jgi:hypothetical protein
VREAGAEPATGADVRLALATHALA